MFQFQTGAIKRQGITENVIVKRSFNSKLVRLKAADIQLGLIFIFKVSIPNWCD